MKRSTKIFVALLLALSLFALSSCGYNPPIPEANTVEELIGYINLYLKHPMKHPEVEENKRYPSLDSLIAYCDKAVLDDTSSSSIIGANFLLDAENGYANIVLSAILEFITDNLDKGECISDTAFPALKSDVLSKVALWEYRSSSNDLLVIITVLDCNCGCDGELWLLSPGETGALVKVSVG